MSIITLKEIKPTRLKVEAINDEIRKEADAVSKDMLLDAELTTWTWDHDVKFDRVVEVMPDGVLIEVSTQDRIWRYVDEGTKAHIITPKMAKVLRFPGTYTAKTVPGVMTARAGGASGPDVFAKVVRHPGTKPRNFSKELTKRWQPRSAKRLQQAIDRGIKRSGHGV